MAQLTMILLCGVVAVLNPVTFALPKGQPAPAVNSTLDYLERVLTGLDRAMTFFHRERRHVNLDAAIGTRILEATLTVLLRKMKERGLSRAVPSDVITHIEALRKSSRDFSNAAVPSIQRQEPEYYQKIGPIINEGLFELDYESRDLGQSVTVWPYNPEEAMEEDESDDCLAEVFGSRNGVTCSISDQCWSRMTRQGYSGYSLSHQIFYLQIAERFGCEVEMLAKMYHHGQGSLTSLHNTFCGNMLTEAERIAEKGFQMDSQDLFMEQAALCGMLGYRDFFSSEWVDEILGWQDQQDGCYKWDQWPLDIHRPGHRAKREEKRVSHGCLCHRTTVAVAALSQYVRYILEVWLQEHGLAN